jgi:hypothetical protein
MPQFILKIDLGNDAMKRSYDVAEAVQRVVDRLQYHGFPEKSLKPNIRDINGNVVGHYEVIP